MLEPSSGYKLFVSTKESPVFKFKDGMKWQAHKSESACTQKNYKVAFGLHPCSLCDCPDFVWDGSSQVCQYCLHAFAVHM
jgi:hypothetical protein